MENDIEVNEARIESLRKLFKVDGEDLELLKQAGDSVLPFPEQFLTDLQNHILSFPELAAVFKEKPSCA